MGGGDIAPRTPAPPQRSAGLQDSAEALVDRYDLAIVDLDGVVYVGAEAVPGAADALRTVRGHGMRTCFLTNNASRTPQQVAEHLTGLGIAASESDVLTSAQVAAAVLARMLPPGAPVLLVGGDGLDRALRGTGLIPVGGTADHPRAVVQGFHPDIGWRMLAAGSHGVRSGLPWVATNLDGTVPTPEGPAPGNGTLVGVIVAATGRSPDIVAGKPQPEPFREAVRRAGSCRPLVIGDRLDTDLEGARAAGMDGLLVLTGVSGAREVLGCPAHRRPHYLGRDLTDLLHPHPPVTCAPLSGTGPDGRHGFTSRCREAVVDAEPAGLRVRSAGEGPLDLLRAACVAEWALADTWPTATGEGSGGGRHAEVLTMLQRFDAGLSWAR